MPKTSKSYLEARNDMVLGALTAVFSALYFAETFHFQLRPMPNTVDAAFVPRILGVIIFLCSGLLFWQGWKAYRKIPAGQRSQSPEEKLKNRRGLLRIGEVFAILLAAAVLFKKLGFLLTMPWMMFLLFVILEKKEKRRYKLYLVISILAPLLLFFVFYYAFSSLLPMGLLTPYLSQIL